MTERKINLELDEDDYRSINQAIIRRQKIRIIPEGGGNLAGRFVAEICRGWMELMDEDYGH